MREYVVIVSKNCPSCEWLKKKLPPESGVKFLDVSVDPEAVRIARDLDIMAVPTFVVIDRELAELCALDKNMKPVKCVKRVRKPNKAR